MTQDTRRTTELVYARNMWRDYDEEYQQIEQWNVNIPNINGVTKLGESMTEEILESMTENNNE